MSRAHVSQTVQKLERRVGVPLFERSARRIRLTPIGIQLRDGLAPATGQLAFRTAEVFRERHPDWPTVLAVSSGRRRPFPNTCAPPVGAVAGTFQEVLTLVGAGTGVFPCGAKGVRYGGDV
ncbi:LysR family transcriptional regulator [Nonomuraea sp. NPDC049646]|uniref:LysR family transcriptional regulator n=1 Tax=unclassified Nonomuraea TaxID=2593643 RepID=UPI00379AEB36